MAVLAGKIWWREEALFANDGEKREAFSRGEREKRGRKESLGLYFE
jgi:hypothetical protein